jgi:hypothetical protein
MLAKCIWKWGIMQQNIQSLQNFVSMVTPELNTDEAKRAVTYVLSSTNLD